MSTPVKARPSLLHVLAIHRTVAIVLLSVLCFGLGEQLWERYVPVYLQARSKDVVRQTATLGALAARTLWIVGLYSCLRNVFEGFCYVGGGQLTARLGDRGSLLLFGLLTVLGYLLFLTWSAPVGAVVAALLILGWEPLSVPVTFTTVGSTVSQSGRGMAFALQSIQKRLPKILGPLIAGFVLTQAQNLRGAEQGTVEGTRWLVSVSLILGLISLAIQWRWMPHHVPPDSAHGTREILRRMHPTLRRLLLAEVFKRWCDWLVRDFVVLYVYFVRGLSLEQFGVFVAVQHTVSLLTYLPIGRLTRTVGLQPFIGVTFVFFALFPLTLALLPGGNWLLLAFVVNGLREIGEPARKALITSLLPPEIRARGVGLYWGLRAFAISTASLAGAGIWLAFGARTLLCAAFGCGCIGAALFYLLCRAPVDVASRERERPEKKMD
jgi:predicted MFS family arabinose efflux permease